MKPLLIVSRACQAFPPNCAPIRTEVGITQPVFVKKWRWEVTMSLGDIDGESLVFTGADSWQAMQHGMHAVYIHLLALEERGWKFLWMDGEESDLRSLLPMNTVPPV